MALDAKTGEVIWKYQRPIADDLPLCCGKVNRGLAILDNSLFFASLDGYLVAIDANTGKVNWQTQVANPSDGFSLTGAPLIVNHSVVIGVAGGDYGIRGFLAAYDVTTGQQKWKFDTIPGPGEAGHETWQNEAWKTGGGSTWVTGSYDPSLDLLYWGVGNPAPPFDGDGRPGDNLFTDSVVALHASSGKLAWYFQFTPHDEHDWDSTQTPILADLLIDGLERKVICWPNRNGFYYVLDRVTGQFLTGTPFVEINWAQGLTSLGRPIPADANTVMGVVNYETRIPGRNKLAACCLQSRAGINFHRCHGRGIHFYENRTRSYSPPRATWILCGQWRIASRSRYHRGTGTGRSHGRQTMGVLLAAAEGLFGGMLATAGGLVFGASGGSLFALDAVTGKELWSVGLGGITCAPPISFTLEGQQVIAVFAGRAMFLFGL